MAFPRVGVFSVTERHPALRNVGHRLQRAFRTFGYFRILTGWFCQKSIFVHVIETSKSTVKTLSHYMVYFKYLNTTIYGKERTLLFETLSIPGALLVADPFESHVKETVTNIATQSRAPVSE